MGIAITISSDSRYGFEIIDSRGFMYCGKPSDAGDTFKQYVLKKSGVIIGDPNEPIVDDVLSANGLNVRLADIYIIDGVEKIRLTHKHSRTEYAAMAEIAMNEFFSGFGWYPPEDND